GDEGLLRDLHLAELAHALLALLLLLEQLALARDVPSVALGQHVLPQRADGLAGDDASADRRLDRDLEEVRRDQLLQLLAHRPPAALGARAVHDDGNPAPAFRVAKARILHGCPGLVALDV